MCFIVFASMESARRPVIGLDTNQLSKVKNLEVEDDSIRPIAHLNLPTSLATTSFERKNLRKRSWSVALKDCKPGFITFDGEETTFTLEGIVAFLFVCRDDPEATPKHKRLGDLVERAIEEIGAGKRVQ